jgi:hypothetical protein
MAETQFPCPADREKNTEQALGMLGMALVQKARIGCFPWSLRGADGLSENESICVSASGRKNEIWQENSQAMAAHEGAPS